MSIDTPPTGSEASPDRALLTPWSPRVLVVDDDVLCQRGVEIRLESLGLAVDLAGDGAQALALCSRWPYVAVFLDCAMPNVDGYRAAREIRRRDGASLHAAIIAVTTHARHVCLAAGMDHHIAKPVRIDALATDCARLGLLPGASQPPEADVVAAPLLDSTFPSLAARGESHAAEVAGRFLRRARQHLPLLWRAGHQGDGAGLARIGEELSERAQRVGAARVAAICQQFPRVAHRREFERAAGLQAVLWTALADTAAAVLPSLQGQRVPGPFGFEAPVPAPPARPPGPIRVALADDDPFARAAVTAMLEPVPDIRLVGAAAGVEEIVTLVRDTPVDVVLLDWMMPAGGGVAAAQQITARHPEVRIVALTGATGPQAYLEMLRAGADGLTVKGAPVAKLTDMIRTVFTRQSRPAPEATPGTAAADSAAA